MNEWLRPSRDPNQLALIPEPVEHLGPEPPPPRPGPIRGAQAYAETEGWIPEDSASCLYISAGVDTRPLTYLRPEVIPEEVVTGRHLPRFLVLVDRDEPADPDEMAFNFDDGRTRIETIEEQTVDSVAWDIAALLRVRVTSDRYASRDYAVLRVKADNEQLCQAAIIEGWLPQWFIGIRDGCRMFFSQNPCWNVIESVEDSIPLRLGVSFWLTDHFPNYGLTDEDWHRIHPFGHSVPVVGGQRLLEMTTWRRWPTVGWGVDRWVSLFRVERG